MTSTISLPRGLEDIIRQYLGPRNKFHYAVIVGTEDKTYIDVTILWYGNCTKDEAVAAGNAAFEIDVEALSSS